MAERVLFRDVVPYDTPSALSALRGPAAGVIELPVTVHWGPQRHYDLDDPDQARFAYQQVVREGTTADQETLLNEAVLRRVWMELMLPERCRRTWENRFPTLAAAA